MDRRSFLLQTKTHGCSHREDDKVPIAENFAMYSSYKPSDKKLIFKPQYSTLDRSNPVSAASPFIGFYTLFWLGLVMFTIRTILVSYRTTGKLFGQQILTILGKDLLVLGLTDGVMFASTFLNVLVQKAVYKHWISWNGLGWKLQHVTPS
jgi:sterol O-acyltransferase